MNTFKRALIEVEKILQYYISIADNIDSVNLEDKEIKSIKHIIKSLDNGCSCNPRIEYDCGCNTRNYVKRKSLKKLKKIESLKK